MKRYKGKLSIVGNCSGGDSHDKVFIELIDATSGCRLVEVEIDKRDFADVIFSLAERPCEFDFYDACPLGKVPERKTVEVFVVDGPYKQREEIARHAVEVYEVDGWRGNVQDATNGHCRIKSGESNGIKGAWYRVTYIRYVEAAKDGD